MTVNRKMICPRCGVPMNFHAEKPDPADDARIVEIHTCARCGEIASRVAAIREDETNR